MLTSPSRSQAENLPLMLGGAAVNSCSVSSPSLQPELASQILDRVQSLLDEGLFSSARVQCAFVLSSDVLLKMSKTKNSRKTLSVLLRASVLLGDAYRGMGEHRHAMRYYEQATSTLYRLEQTLSASASSQAQADRSGSSMDHVSPATIRATKLPRHEAVADAPRTMMSQQQHQHKTVTASPNLVVFSEGDIRFRFAVCANAVKEYDVAKKSLAAVAPEQRSLSMWLLLARLHEECGEHGPAIQAYRRVSAMRPECVEAFDGVLRLSSSANASKVAHRELFTSEQVDELVAKCIPPLASLLQAQQLIADCKYEAALTILNGLLDHYSTNPQLWAELARAHFKNGDGLAAYYAFQQMRHLDADYLDYVDKFAALLKSQSKLGELNRLADELLKVNDSRPEPWVVLGRYAEMRGNRQRAMAFAEKALNIDRKHAEAHMLRGSVLMSNNRAADALLSFRRAHKLEPDVFTYEHSMEASLTQGKTQEALILAQEASQLLPNHSRIQNAVAVVFGHYAKLDKSRASFQLALELDPRNVDAVLGMANLLSKEKRHREALAILQKYAAYHQTEWMHCRLAETFFLLGDYNKAADHYNQALLIVPEYERARQGLEHLERTKSDNADNMHDAGEFEDDPDGDELLEDNDQDFDVADDFGMV